MKDEKSFQMRLGKLLKATSIRSFAKKCDVSEGSLRRYLKGESDPSMGHVKAIAEAAGVTVGWLIGLEEQNGARGKGGLSVERHHEIGLELFVLSRQLQNLANEFEYSYPKTGELSKVTIYLRRAVEEIHQARDRAEENLFKDFPNSGSDETHCYYPASDIGNDKLLRILSEIAKVYTDACSELSVIFEKKRPSENYSVAQLEPKYNHGEK